MKKSIDLRGLPIISIEEGLELGKVKDIIINAEKKEINSLIIEEEKWWDEAKVISFGLIRGIGEEAITINNSSAIVKISSLPEVEARLENKVEIINCNVITYSGKLIGKITEYFVNPNTGIIEAYLLSEQNLIKDFAGEVILPKNCVSTLGKKVIVVVDETAQYAKKFGEELASIPTTFLTPKPDITEEETTFLDSEKEEEPPKTENNKIMQDLDTLMETEKEEPVIEKQPEKESDDLDKLILELDDEIKKEPEEIPEINLPQSLTKTESEPIVEEPTLEEKVEIAAEKPTPKPEKIDEVKPKTPKKDLTSIFEDRVKKTSLGKKSTKKILTPDGNLIIDEGEEVTAETITKAKKCNKLVELYTFAK